MGFALFYDSPPSGGEREQSAGETFHAPRSRSWDSSAVVLPGTPRSDVWRGRAVARGRVASGKAGSCECTDLRVGYIGPLHAQGSHVIDLLT